MMNGASRSGLYKSWMCAPPYSFPFLLTGCGNSGWTKELLSLSVLQGACVEDTYSFSTSTSVACFGGKTDLNLNLGCELLLKISLKRYMGNAAVKWKRFVGL